MTDSESLTTFSNALAGAVANVAASVVAINARQRGSSSGLLWQPGIVITAEHALKRSEEIAVTLPSNRTVTAVVAGRDPGTDIAVLKLDSGETSAAQFAGPASLHVGQMALAVARRGENGPAASLGIISALSGPWRTWRGGHVETFIRPDVSLYPGFSGGPLADVEGRVIGINTSALTRAAGVTIPALTIDRIMNELLSKGHVARGYLGVGLHPVQLPDGRSGLILLSVEPGAPAQQAGFFVGDVLIAIEGKDVGDTDDVQSHLGPESVGRSLRVSIIRGGSAMELGITPADRPRGENR